MIVETLHWSVIDFVFNASDLGGGDRIEISITVAEHTTHISDRPGADTRYAVNGDKLRSQFTWAPALPIDQSLGDVVEWYLEHKDWWLKIKGRREFQDHYQKQSSGQWY
ncbi:MAG: hypothetical protein HYY51_01020 [Candidatus Magasanikbacteria bacterium]|nr:hypothetical protein [Candidatus Magasanikbacteria bacterium]